MLGRLNKRAQSTAEYAILIAIVVGAAVAMQIYVKRGLQARVHDAVGYNDAKKIDPTTGQPTTENFFTLNQYEPYYNESNMTQTRNATIGEGMNAGGDTTKSVTADISTRTGNQAALGTANAD